MKEIISLEQYNKALEEFKDLMILTFYGKNHPDSQRIMPLLEELQEIYSPSVSFYNVCMQKFLVLASVFHVSSIPTIVILGRNPYGGNAPITHAKLTGDEISKENLIVLISEYKKDVKLR